MAWFNLVMALVALFVAAYAFTVGSITLAVFLLTDSHFVLNIASNRQ
jgi:hypothetical protein